MAKRFKFRLQPVLEQRERAEREQQRRVAEVQRQRVALEDMLRRCQLSIRAAKDDLRERLAPRAANERDRSGLADIRMQAGASLHQTALAQRVAIELAGVLSRLEALRVELAAAAASRKAVELLRARQFEEWKRDQSRREIAELDELASARLVGARSAGGESAGEAGGLGVSEYALSGDQS